MSPPIACLCGAPRAAGPPPDVTVADFRARFPEFASNSDDQITVALADAKPWNGYSAWGTSYSQGVCTLAAHLLAVGNQRATRTSSDGTSRPATGIIQTVAERRAGALLTRYNTAGSAGSGTGSGGGSTPDFLALTSYGQQWYGMARIKGMGAVAIAGELCACAGDADWTRQPP
jgi:hypothetical protein